MAATITPGTPHVVGHRKEVYFDFLGDSSYVTGGYAITPKDVNLSAITEIEGAIAAHATAGLTATYDKANGKIMILRTDQVDDPMEEMPNGGDASGATIRMKARGW